VAAAIPAWSSRPPARRILAVTTVVLAVAAYCYLAAGTRPFTTGADVATAVPYAVLAALLVRTLLRRPTGRAVVAASWRQLRPWALALAVCGAWELVTYVAGLGDRHGFPTVSSLLDRADGSRPAKAAVFAAWLGLGWGLVRR
jgi:hypothetical protein